MNTLLWVLQIALALLYVAGGAYKLSSYDALASQLAALSPTSWRALGIFEILGGILLVVPAATGWTPRLTPLAATALAVETFLLAFLYGRESLDVAVTNPLPWAVVMGVLVAFVAYGRYVLRPVGRPDPR